ncbi:MAG: VWA domain-containing protein [Dehalococcoidia bacterium]|nr:MAG: VWA domain-containing protein [Dehalococcoidia bacterium]
MFRALSLSLPALIALASLSILPAGAQGPPHNAVVLVIDNSGSMAQTDPASLRFAAASQLVDLLEDGDEMSVVLFADDSIVLVPLTRVTDVTTKESIKVRLRPLAPAGNTNMRTGLETGLEELEKGSNSIRFAIFLTDGELHPPDWPNFSAQKQEAERNAVLALAASFGERKWGLFPVSLASAVESEFLQKLAENGGGLYREAPEASELTLVFQEIFAAKKLDVFEVLFSDCLAPGEERSVTFPVHSFVSTLSLFVTYPSDLRPAVMVADPGGEPVAPAGTDARYDAFSIEEPPRGTWTVTIAGPTEGESCLTISSTPRTLLEVVWLRPPPLLNLGSGAPLEVAVRLTARDPQTEEERPVEDATVAVTVTEPDGRSNEGALQPVGSGEYVGTVAVSGVEGRYSIALVAETEEGVVARRSFETSLSAAQVDAPSPSAGPPPTPVPVAVPTAGGNGGGGPTLVLILGPALLAALTVSWAGYAHFGRPTLRGYLTSVPEGRAYDLEGRHCRTWWRRPLTLGGPHDDMDLGLAGRSARIIPRRNGECLLEAVSATDIVVDDYTLRKGQRRPLYDGSEVHLGGVGVIYRSQ